MQNDYYKFQCTDDLDHATYTFSNRQIEVDELPRNDLASAGKVLIYLEHLDKLGLASLRQYRNPEPVFASNKQTQTRTFARYQLTEFGLEFMKSVRPPRP